MSQYNLQSAMSYCEKRGLTWDMEMADKAVKLAEKYDISNEALNAAIHLHIDSMVAAFDPRRFTYWQRVKLALGFAAFWLGIIKPKWAR